MKGRIIYGKPKRYFIGDKEVTEEFFLECFPSKLLCHGRPPAGPALTGWPIVSDALAVHPLDVAKAAESARRHGVPTDFTPQGQPILRDRQHRKAYLQKVRKVVDRNSYYGY